ncbi:hypothetical protein L916_01096 [Phytophthora nicotianae]|uniref:Uncharacterized protein n=1 Tax=Phytophthora nicotianae TaxID=4792 RepID=W2JUT6_PHYNI|nr:hypothetical protein L916_01096 [Phytophthora nicotianae]
MIRLIGSLKSNWEIKGEETSRTQRLEKDRRARTARIFGLRRLDWAEPDSRGPWNSHSQKGAGVSSRTASGPDGRSDLQLDRTREANPSKGTPGARASCQLLLPCEGLWRSQLVLTSSRLVKSYDGSIDAFSFSVERSFLEAGLNTVSSALDLRLDVILGDVAGFLVEEDDFLDDPAGCGRVERRAWQA